MSHLDFSGKSNFGAVGAERFAGVLDSEQSWFTSMSDTITIELQEQEFWEVSCSGHPDFHCKRVTYSGSRLNLVLLVVYPSCVLLY